MIRNDENGQDWLESTADRIIEIQKQWPELVTAKSKETMIKLLKSDLVHMAYENGKIVAACYIQPLDETLPIEHPDQIFRVGGFSVERNGIVDRRKALAVMKSCEEMIKKLNFKMIVKNGNPVVAGFFKRVGSEEVTFSQCQDKYPRQLEAYVRDSSKPREYYQDKSFCVYPPIKIDETADRIIEIQKQWPELVTPKPKDEMVKLLKSDLVHLAYENGKVVAACYLQPLDETLPVNHPEQVFRVGGFSLERNEAVDRRKALAVMKSCEEMIRKLNFKMIVKNGNPVVAGFFKRSGAEEVTYSQCQEKYPKHIGLYLKQSKKPEEYYFDKSFCVYPPLKIQQDD